MSYEIKSLSPALATDFTNYLGTLDFKHAPHWSTCYCMYYQLNCGSTEWQGRTGDQNRTEAVDFIQSGQMKGYLAFDGDTCIGWCHANDVKRLPRIESSVSAITQGKKVGCVICFVVHTNYRGKGVARLLLKSAVENFKIEGYEAVMALPVENLEDREKQYRGTIRMYEELGFEKVRIEGETTAMWLEL